MEHVTITHLNARIELLHQLAEGQISLQTFMERIRELNRT